LLPEKIRFFSVPTPTFVYVYMAAHLSRPEKSVFQFKFIFITFKRISNRPATKRMKKKIITVTNIYELQD